MGDREHPASARLEDPGNLTHHGGAVHDERDRAEGGAGDVHGTVAQRQRSGVRLQEGGHSYARPRVEGSGMAKLGEREIDGNDAGALADQPACALASAAAHFEHDEPADRAQQPRLRLAQTFRAPQEVGVAEETRRARLGRRRPRRPTSGGWRRRSGAREPARRRPPTVAARHWSRRSWVDLLAGWVAGLAGCVAGCVGSGAAGRTARGAPPVLDALPAGCRPCPHLRRPAFPRGAGAVRL